MKNPSNKYTLNRWSVTGFIIMFLLAVICGNAQDKRFASYLITDPTEQFNIGAGLEYQMTISYFKVELQVQGNDIKAQGTLLGFNYHYDNFRGFAGGKAGLVRRYNYTYPMLGIETGLEWYFDKWYVGSQLAYDWRTDDKYYNPKATGYSDVAVGFKIGFWW